MRMFFPFMKKVFVIEELDDSFRMVESDPRTEDWEHIYRDVLEGMFYPTNEQLNGYFFATEDHVDNPWFEVLNGIPSKNISSNEQLLEIRQRWGEIKLSLDQYVVRQGKTTYYMEDTNNFNKLLRLLENSKLIRYADTIFVVKMSKNNIPLEAYAVVRVSNRLEIKSIDSTT